MSSRTNSLREFISGSLHLLPLLPAWTPCYDPFDDFKSTPSHEFPEPDGLWDSAAGVHRPDVSRRAADQMTQIDIPQKQAILISRQAAVTLEQRWASCPHGVAVHLATSSGDVSMFQWSVICRLNPHSMPSESSSSSIVAACSLKCRLSTPDDIL